MEKTLKEQALEKMLEELNQPHHQALDTLHLLLVDHGDDEIYAGILKEGKSLTDAYRSMFEYGRKNQAHNSYGMDGTLALSVVRDYLNDTTTTPDVAPPVIEPKPYKMPKNVTGEGVANAPKPKKEEPKKNDVNMSIFDFMDDAEESDDENESED